MTTLYDVPAPAKINLFLHVTGRRRDGYHQLQTVFRFIGLYDYLDFERRSDGVIYREGTAVQGLAADDDLVVRAARALQAATGTRYGASIHYRKTIPAGGGLGGGSSNAASTLIALNRLWRTGLSRRQLQEIGASLGADVPVFIFGDAAFAQGTGDQLQALSLPEAAYVVIQPYASISTGQVFSAPDLTRNSKPVTITVFTDWLHANAGKSAGTTPRYFGRNNLEPIALQLDAGLAKTSRWLVSQGINARMTGSGSCFFVECSSLHQALAHQQEILVKINRYTDAVVKQVWACPGLHEHPLKCWVN